jgi:hypothetical protein
MTFAEIGCEQSRLVFKGSDSRVTPTVGAFRFLLLSAVISEGRAKGGRQGEPSPQGRFRIEVRWWSATPNKVNRSVVHKGAPRK